MTGRQGCSRRGLRRTGVRRVLTPFGLSMDFGVFLVSQIKEHADAGEDPKRSVVSGLLTGGRVITAAATIMVFGSFVLNGDRTVKLFGIGLAVAVILDATVVGCVLVPARTAGLGKANWHLLRWLGKILPRISIECEKYVKPAIGSRPQSSSKPSRSRRSGCGRRPLHRSDDCPS
jgi:putative drug exporter of the RND superfamily